MSALQLRPYQKDAVKAVHDAAARGIRRPLVAMATGLGKSLTAAYVAKERGGRTIFLAHRDELLRQLARSVQNADPQARIGFVKAEEDEVDADVVVASIQTLARPARLERLLSSTRPKRTLFDEMATRPFRTVIADEAHHHTGGDEENTFGAVLRGLGAYDDHGPLVVGWTATPERGDGKALGSVFEEIVYEMGILKGMASGYLCDITAKQIKLAADFNKLKVRAGDFSDDESADMLMAADAPKHVAEAYMKHAKDRKALVFTPTIAVAEAMTQAFKAQGVRAETAHGMLSTEERSGVLRRFKSGETMVVPNSMLLTEGFDEPSVNCIVVARPTRSRPFAIQMIGRGTRIFPGKEDCLVMDVVGSVARMDLVTVASLFGVADGEVADKGVLAAVAAKQDRDKKRATAGLPVDDGREGQIVSVDVSLFKKREFHWVDVGGRFLLTLGDGKLLLQPGVEADSWDIIKRTREVVGRYPRDVDQKTHAGLSLEAAQSVAEDMVRAAGTKILNDPKAAWRAHPASVAQKEYLMKKRRWRDGMSKGEAHDTMERMFAGRR